MSLIGIFNKNEDGTISGVIQTLMIDRAIEFHPVTQASGNAPDYRARVSDTESDIGAAWEKTSKEGNPYLGFLAQTAEKVQ